MFEKKAKERAKDYTDNAKRQVAYECGFLDGVDLGYNKANEWHYVKDGDLPNTETKNYTYIRRRKRYERQFTDYRVIKCFVLCQNEKGKITAEVGYFDCNQKCFLNNAEDIVIAWKEIVLPKESEIESEMFPEITLPKGSAEFVDKVIADAEKKLKESE